MTKLTVLPIVLIGLFTGLAHSATAQKVEAVVAFNRYKVTDSTSIVEMHFLASGRNLQYVKSAQGKLQAAVELAVEASDKAGIKAFDKLRLLSPVVTDTVSGKTDLQTVKRWVLKNGNYTIRLATADPNRPGTESEVNIPLELGAKDAKSIQISDLALLSSYRKAEKESELTRHGYEMLPYVSSFLPAQTNKLTFFAEIYNTDKNLGSKEPFVITYGLWEEGVRGPLTEYSKHKKDIAAPVNVLLAELDISKLPSGNYNLFVEFRDKENKVRSRQEKFIQRSNPAMALAQLTGSAAGDGDRNAMPTFALSIDTTKLDFYLLSQRPLASTEEVAFANTLVKSGSVTEKQRFIEHFWRKRDPLHTEAKWLEFKKRADYVEKTFRTKAFNGYQTDRGRVYIQYGEPNLIHNERNDVIRTANQNNDVIPYQIWQYYHTETKNQNNVQFVFVQQNMASNSFKLTHSTARGEVSNPDWRYQVLQKFRDFRKEDPSQ